MAGETPPPNSRITPRLIAELERINFYRFCQILEKSRPDKPLLGSNQRIQDDPVRFCPHPGMGFPVSEFKAIEFDEDNPIAPPVVRTTFMGLYGVDSPLPTAFLDEITQQREGHEALQGFLDIFNHRILTQFYRIWRKYSYPASFEPGGQDKTSQCLLSLVGLGIPGVEKTIPTPISRFLSLLSVLRQPGRTEEGVQSLVRLIAPHTTVKVSPHCIRWIQVEPCLLDDVMLDGNTPLGDEVGDANSQLLVELTTNDETEASNWLPDQPLYRDFLILLRVYLGWRYKAKINLTLTSHLLAVRPLGESSFQLGLTGILGEGDAHHENIGSNQYTLELGVYEGMQSAIKRTNSQNVKYQFS